MRDEVRGDLRVRLRAVWGLNAAVGSKVNVKQYRGDGSPVLIFLLTWRLARSWRLTCGLHDANVC